MDVGILPSTFTYDNLVSEILSAFKQLLILLNECPEI